MRESYIDKRRFGKYNGDSDEEIRYKNDPDVKDKTPNTRRKVIEEKE